MISEVIFKLHLDSHIITQPVKITHQDTEQFQQMIANLLGQFSTIGISEKQEDGTLKHFPAHRISFVGVEFPRVTIAGPNVPSEVRLG